MHYYRFKFSLTKPYGGRILLQPLLDLSHFLSGSLITEIFEKQFVCHLSQFLTVILRIRNYRRASITRLQ